MTRPRSGSGHRIVVGLVLLTLTIAAPGSAVAGAAQFEPGAETITEITVEADGNATVTFEVRIPLADEAGRTAFERVERDVAENRSEEVASFERSVRELTDRAAERTGRRMTVSNVSVETETVELPRTWGIVRYRFEWGNFAAASGDRVVVDGVLSGYLLSDGDTLTVRFPPDMRVETVEPSPDVEESTRLTWHGPREFAGDEPVVVLVPRRGGPVPGGSAGIAVLALVIVAGAAVFVRRHLRDRRSPTLPGTTVQAGDLSDREIVLHLLATESGRLKQQVIVSRTGWNETKVSKITSELEADGLIRKLRIGRENILELVDVSAPERTSEGGNREP